MIIKFIKKMEESNDLNDFKNEFNKKGQSHEKFKKEIEDNEKKIEGNGKRLEEHSKKIKELSKKIEEHEKITKENIKKIEEHEKELEENGKKIEENGKELEEIRKQIEEHEKELEENDKKIKENKKELEENGKNLKENKNMLEKIKKEIKEININISFIIGLLESRQNTKNNNDENEIINKLEEIELNEQFKNKDEIKCAICLENFSIGDKIIYLPCVHFFHSSCIKNWVRIKSKCPICNNIIKFP